MTPGLGPLLLSIYIQPLGNMIWERGKDRHEFVDDGQFYEAFGGMIYALLFPWWKHVFRRSAEFLIVA